jgi:hypothetical protein
MGGLTAGSTTSSTAEQSVAIRVSAATVTGDVRRLLVGAVAAEWILLMRDRFQRATKAKKLFRS